MRYVYKTRHSHTTVPDCMKVGNEFSQVEGLWSQFENVMAKAPEKEEEEEEQEVEEAKNTKEGASEETAR